MTGSVGKVKRVGAFFSCVRGVQGSESLHSRENKQTNKKQRLHAISVEENEINHLSMDVSVRGTLLYKEREGIESTCGEW